MRRLFFGFLAALLMLPLSMTSVLAAQDATPAPESAFADLELPALDVTVTVDGYEGIPDSLEAGRYLVTITAAEETGEFGGGVAFVQPVGVTVDEFLQALAGPPDETGVGAVAATPVEGGVATPVDAGVGEEVPDFVFDSVFAGGIYASPGAPAQVVLDLTPGEWVAWGDDPEAPQQPVAFDVTGEMPEDLPEPASSARITMGEYVIAVTEGELASGSQVVQIDNLGAQPHFVAAVKGPDGITEAQVETILDEEMQAEMTGTPPVYSDINPEEEFDFEAGFFSGTQSQGTSAWIPIDLAPGTYILVCFFPDVSDGVPHAYHGMYTVVEVAE